MLSAEHIVETMNRLSEAELVSTIKYGVSYFLLCYFKYQIIYVSSTITLMTVSDYRRSNQSSFFCRGQRD